MKQIPTAEEFFDNLYPHAHTEHCDVSNAMIEFTKLHVEAALKEARKKATTIDTYKTRWNRLNKETYIEKDIYPESILNAYPLENIK